MNEAKVNVTYMGQNGDLKDPLDFDATDARVREMITEALRTGDIPGINAVPDADLSDFVLDRFSPNDARPNYLIALRPKTPFGTL